jgi:hypothetical protein
MSLYNWDLRRWIECEESALRELVPLVELFVEKAEQARREGLLMLEDDLNELSDLLMRDGLQLVVDGTDPDLIRSIMEKRILAGGQSGLALRRELIILEGTLAIQSGIKPDLIRALLSAFLAPKVSELYGKESDERSVRESMEERLARIGERSPTSGYTSLLEKIGDYDDHAIRLILREVDNDLLAKALYGAGSNVIRAVVRSLPPRAADLLLGEMEVMFPVSESDTHSHQVEICQIIERLISEGEIEKAKDNPVP